MHLFTALLFSHIFFLSFELASTIYHQIIKALGKFCYLGIFLSFLFFIHCSFILSLVSNSARTKTHSPAKSVSRSFANSLGQQTLF